MAATGFSGVLGPAVLWYSASQALLTGVVILAMLVSLQEWRIRGGPWRLLLGVVASAAAPLFWTAGYIGGLVGMAYLAADRRPACRRASLVPVLGTAVTAVAVWLHKGRHLVDNLPSNNPILSLTSVARSLVNTFQAIPEVLVFGNLGLLAPVSRGQGLVLSTLLLAAWIGTRRSPRLVASPTTTLPANQRLHRPAIRQFPRWFARLAMPIPNPLEAAGLTLILAGFGIVFLGRGTFGFESLRSLGWYHAIPQLGAVLFGAGWWMGRIDSPPPRCLRVPSGQALLSVAGVSIILLTLQAPRVDQIVHRFDGLAAPFGVVDTTTHRLVGSADSLGAPWINISERALRQARFLEHLDQLERFCQDRGISRNDLRSAIAGRHFSEWPTDVQEVVPADLLILPAQENANPRDARQAVDRFLSEEFERVEVRPG
jgi:hypothetical protein